MTIKNGELPNANDVLTSIGSTTAQLAYEQVKSDSTEWTNTDYLGADIFTVAAGAKTTIDTSASTGGYSNNLEFYTTYDNSLETINITSSHTFSGSSIAKKGFKLHANTTHILGIAKITSTHSSSIYKKWYLGTTSGGSELASGDIDISGNTGIMIINEELTTGNDYYLTFDNSGRGIILSTTSSSFPYNNTNLNVTANSDDGTGNLEAPLINLETYDSINSASTVETNSIMNDIIPDSIVVYGKTTLPTNTSITVDVSDDGGTTFSLTGKSLNTAIDTSSFTTGNLALKFNLATTDTSVTPKLYGYGLSITDR